MKITLQERINSYVERARTPIGVVVYINLHKDGVRCCAAHNRAFEELAKLSQVGAVDIAGVYRVDSLHPKDSVARAMLRDLREVGVWE